MFWNRLIAISLPSVLLSFFIWRQVIWFFKNILLLTIQQTLQKYTRDYLFDKFRVDYLRQKRPSPRHHPIHHHPQPLPPHVGPLSHGSRPILAIDTAPHQSMHRHPPPPMSAASRDMLGGDHLRSATVRPMSDSIPSTSGVGPHSAYIVSFC